MKKRSMGFAVAALLVAASALPSRAGRAADPAPTADPAAAPPANMPRSSILPQTAGPSTPQEPTP